MTRIPSRRDVLKTGSALALGATLGTRARRRARSRRARRSSTSSPRRKARSPGTPRIPTTRPREALGRDFDRAFPGIKANVVRTTAQVAYQRVHAGAQGRRDAGATCFSSTDIGHYVRLKAEGQAREIRAGQRQRRSCSRSTRTSIRTATTHVTSAGLVAITYNTAKVKPRRRAEEVDRTCSTPNGRTRSRSAIRASPAMSAPGW